MPKKTRAQNNIPNPLEAVSHLGTDLRDSLVKDVAKGSMDTFFQQLLGANFDSAPVHADKAPEKAKPAKGGAIEIFSAAGKHKSEKAHPSAEMKQKPERAAAIDYHRDIVKSSEKASRVAHSELDQKIHQITIELKKLIDSSKLLQTKFKTVAVEQKSQEIGEYHAHFFEWMLIVIQNARAKVEDSGAWLSAVKGKGKGKKGGDYWGMFKKHGTSFGLSSERTVATQTG